MQPRDADRMDRDEIMARVEHARRTSRVLLRLGWGVLLLGLVALVVTGVLLLIGEIDVEQALAAALGTALGTVLSGATAYGSGVNLGLGADRVVLSLRSGHRPGGPEDG